MKDEKKRGKPLGVQHRGNNRSRSRNGGCSKSCHPEKTRFFKLDIAEKMEKGGMGEKVE